MPTVTISRKVLERIIGKKLPEEELKDRISMIGTDLEKMDDNEITVEVFPNRPDMLSEQGFGRALSSFIGVKTGLRKYSIKPSGQKVIVADDMKDVRPYTVCAIVKNLKLDDDKVREIIQIQEKLHVTFCRRRKKAAIGIYTLDKIRLPIHFMARKPGEIKFRPLESDREMTATEILEKHPTGQAYKHLVAKLKRYAVFTDSDGKILSFTPVINSHETGKITEKTKEAFIEVSGFELHTCQYVLNILVTSLADMGADIYSMEVVYPDRTLVTPDLTPKEIKVDADYINKWLGVDLKDHDIKECLEKMGYGYSSKTAKVPAYRPDVLHPVDLAEDIAIAYGYENFKPQIPTKATAGKEDSFEKFRKNVARIMVGLGMLETNTYHLSSEDVQFRLMRLEGQDVVKLSNSQSEGFTIMRQWMMPSLMQVLKDNTHNEYPQNIFESGYVFRLESGQETGVRETCSLASIVCSADADYTKIRQVLDALMRSLGLECQAKEADHPFFIEGRSADIYVKGKKVGFIGEMHPEVLVSHSLEMPAAAFQIDLTLLFSMLS